MQMQRIAFTLNGKPVETYVDVRASLTDVLRKPPLVATLVNL